ncbi:hypothetical protein [Jeotgalibacillus proteolyticus]|uniref:Uncharacterized protein n=1 Tax=Jeotgalibacillus proteolyticus TaxID=2082395 RepID=A0A2S5GG81_9BACL|nr:hypothetical protein [Jeotgalibacillus proteolyticus]PPA71873.1 hypothetical protein C4B60_00395 [Jeotgalibacillus proteolyticus]
MSKDKKDRTSNKYQQPDRIDSEEESLLDKFEDEQMTDPIPVEDLKQDLKYEKKKTETQKSSSSEKMNPSK